MLVWSDEVATSRKISFLFLSCKFAFTPTQLHNNKTKNSKGFFWKALRLKGSEEKRKSVVGPLLWSSGKVHH